MYVQAFEGQKRWKSKCANSFQREARFETIINVFQPLPKSQAHGEILFYSVATENLDRPSSSQLISVPAPANGTELSLDGCSHQIRVTASNSAGVSPASVMVIAGDPGSRELCFVSFYSPGDTGD